MLLFQKYRTGNHKFNFAYKKDRGLRTTHNEDYILCPEGVLKSLKYQLGHLFVLCDGVGGANAGEIASQMTATWILKDYYSIIQTGDRPLPELLYDIIIQTNARVYNLSLKYPLYHGMGTTLVIALLLGNKCYVFSVGDSRLYLFRDGALIQITEDQSEVWQLFKLGQITKDELRSHPRNNIITMSMGMPENPTVFRSELDIIKGDRLILCSDGLTDMVSDDRMKMILEKNHFPKKAVRKFIKEANTNGGKDNISVICINILDK